MPEDSDVWDKLCEQVAQLSGAVKRVASVAVNSNKLKGEAKSIVQFYFRAARASVLQMGVAESELSKLDDAFQSVNSLAQGNNRRTSYLELLRIIRAGASEVGLRRHVIAGERAVVSFDLTQQQICIIQTLEKMLPDSAKSFEQALIDLSSQNRLSYRGTAAELREVLRETIDHLAPDDDVISLPGFQYEKDHRGEKRNSPTLRQKVKFILKTRGTGGNAISNSQDTLNHIESGAEKIARSIYNRGSAATHKSQDRSEVISIQRYTEVLLAELLEIQ